MSPQVAFPRRRAIAALVSLAFVSCSGSAAPTRNNLLAITVDTLRADRLGCDGYPRETSPALDRLASRGVLFERAWSHTSWTLPSLATLLTSTYGATHGCLRLNRALHSSFLTLPEVLAAEGYRTAAVTSHVFFGRRYGMDQGFAHFDEELLDPVRPAEEDLSVEVSRDEWKRQQEELTGSITSPGVSERGIELLRSFGSGADPWMLFLHYFDPHGDYLLHDGVSERFGTARPSDRYDGEVAFTDRHIGELLEELDRLGLADRTVVVVTADHGEEFGEHGGSGHKQTLYRECLRVPLIIAAPGFTGRRVPDVVRMVDVMPTLLDLLAVPAPADLAGVSLRPLMQGEPSSDLPAYGALTKGDATALQSLVQGRWKLIVDHVGATGRVDPNPSSTVGSGPHVFLFDLAADVAERHNVAEEHPRVVRRLMRRIEAIAHDARELGRSERYAPGEALELSDDELQHLRDLGY